MKRGLILAALHLAIVFSLVGKYAWDYVNLPRAWARTENYDPNLPIRGRYVRLWLAEVPPTGRFMSTGRVQFTVSDGRLITTPVVTGGTFNKPIAFFIPEHAEDPTRLKPGEELWVELSVPKHGRPRPIRLAVKKPGQQGFN